MPQREHSQKKIEVPEEKTELLLKITADNIYKGKRKYNIAWITILKVLYEIAQEEPKSTPEIMSKLREHADEIPFKSPPRSILHVLRTLEKMGFLESMTPIGVKRPLYWILTDMGKRLVEKILQLEKENTS